MYSYYKILYITQIYHVIQLNVELHNSMNKEYKSLLLSLRVKLNLKKYNVKIVN